MTTTTTAPSPAEQAAAIAAERIRERENLPVAELPRLTSEVLTERENAHAASPKAYDAGRRDAVMSRPEQPGRPTPYYVGYSQVIDELAAAAQRMDNDRAAC